MPGEVLPPRHRFAELMLFVSAAAWATTFASMRWLVNPELGSHGVWSIVAFRFVIGAVLTLIWCPSVLAWRGVGREWIASLWLGVLLTVAFVTQTVGLITTTASKSAFITALFVVFVPLLQHFHLRQPLTRRIVPSIVLALAGMTLLERPWGGQVVIGDLWTLVCAVGYSLYIVELQRLSPGASAERLLFGQLALMAVLGVIISNCGGTFRWPADAWSWALLLYLAAVCTFLSTLLHNRYQRETTPTRAALVFTSEPVLASLLAWATLGEGLGLLGILGAGLILSALVLAELK